MAIAQRAVALLTGEYDAASQHLATASRAVMAGAIGVLLNIAAREAGRIIEDQKALDRRRSSLDVLAMRMTDLERQLGRRPGEIRWPETIRTVLTAPPEPARLPSEGGVMSLAEERRWLSVAAALLNDPEAEPDLDATS